MKKIIFILALMLSMGCKSQTIYPLGTTNFNTNNYYIKDTNNHHDAIVGVWKWENGNDSFEITLQEFEQFSFSENSSISRDCVFGKYSYIQDSVVISEVLNIDPLPNTYMSFYFNSPTEYNVVIKDIISEKTKKGKFTLTSNTTAEIEFFDIKGIIVGGNGNGQEWSLPTSVTLTKIN